MGFPHIEGALEGSPQISTAVVLAAGEGTRLRPHTLDRPKCLVEVGARPLLGRALDALARCGVERVVLVTGYREDALLRFLAARPGGPQVVPVRNEEYASTNNAYSLWTARAAVPGAFMLLDADLLFEPAVLAAVLAAQGEAVLAVDRRPDLGEEEMKVLLGPDVSVTAVNKTMDPAQAIGESVGVARFSADAARALWDRLDAQVRAGQRNVYYELAFEQMIAAGWRYRVADVSGLLCMEIDTPADLDAAHALARRIDARAELPA
jgi:choline kinase